MRGAGEYMLVPLSVETSKRLDGAAMACLGEVRDEAAPAASNLRIFKLASMR